MTEFESPSLLPDERLDRINEDIALIQKKGGLTFGSDAYLLAAMARPCPNRIALDLGAGTGVASLLCLAKEKYRAVYAAEIQADFCDLIRRNAVLNRMEDRLHPVPGDIRELQATSLPETPAVVFSNPPYLPAGAGLRCADTQKEIARREENGTIADFCAVASRMLTSGGYFYTVYRPDRAVDLLTALRGAKLEPKRMITVYPDTESRPCLILVESRKDGAPQLLQSPPLIIYESPASRQYTPQMQRVYDTFSLEFLFETGKGFAR